MQLILTIAAGYVLAQRPPRPSPGPSPGPPRPPGPGGVVPGCKLPCKTYGPGVDATTPIVCESNDGDGDCAASRGGGKGYHFCQSDATACQQQGVAPSPPAPMPTVSFMDAIKASGQGKVFLTEAIKFGYDKTLIGPSNGMTLFIPTDEAMAAVMGAYSKANKTVQSDWLLNHMSKSRGGLNGRMTKELTDGGAIPTVAIGIRNTQDIFSMKTGDAKSDSWSISNADLTVTADVTVANIQGYTGPSTGPVGRGVAHIISRVLVPINFVPYGECKKLSKLGCPPSDDQCTTTPRYSRGGECCCSRRPGPPRPTPPPGPPPPRPGTLPPCPTTCKTNFQRCSKQYDVQRCINMAAERGLCGPSVACNASSLTSYDCGGGRVQEPIMMPECASTCEDPMDGAACKAAYADKSREPEMTCHCPWGQTYDEEEGQCVKSCGDGTSCVDNIEEDYLDSGIAAAKCPDSSIGATCKTRCITFKCVADPDFADQWYMDKYCGRSTDEETCSNANRGGKNICEWIGADTGYPPTFVCSTMANGEPIWTIDQPSNCQAGGGAANEVCDYFEETECLTKSSCDDGTWSDACEEVASNVVKGCKGKCGGFNDPTMRDNKECASCIFDQLMRTNTVEADVTDAVACCGCLDEAFLKVLPGVSKLTADTLNDILYAPCEKKPDIDEDDDKTRV